MSRANYKKIYEEILSKITANGTNVFHREIKCNGNIITSGFYDPYLKHIVIRKEIYGTKVGIETLLHEYGHFLDHKNGKFKTFFNGKVQYFTKEEMRQVVAAEKSAARYAKKQCAKYGIVIEPEELTEDGIITLKAIWLQAYFKQRKRK